MRYRRIFTLIAASLNVACVNIPIPGIYYDVHLSEPFKNTICVETAQKIADATALRVSGSYVPPQRPTECIAELRIPGRKRLAVTIQTDPIRNYLFVDIQENGWDAPKPPSAPTILVAQNIQEAIRKQFPTDEITVGKRFRGFLGP